jgi:excisionase family DNA binding protein
MREFTRAPEGREADGADNSTHQHFTAAGTPVHRFLAFLLWNKPESNVPLIDDDRYWDSFPSTLTVHDMVQILRLSKRSVFVKLNSGDIPGYQIAASWIMFKPEIRAWLATLSNQPATAPPPFVDVLDEFPEEMTYQELMALFRKTKQTIYVWLRDGQLPGYRTGTHWIVHKSQLRGALRAASNQQPKEEEK